MVYPHIWYIDRRTFYNRMLKYLVMAKMLAVPRNHYLECSLGWLLRRLSPEIFSREHKRAASAKSLVFSIYIVIEQSAASYWQLLNMQHFTKKENVFKSSKSRVEKLFFPKCVRPHLWLFNISLLYESKEKNRI